MIGCMKVYKKKKKKQDVEKYQTKVLTRMSNEYNI